MILSKCHRCPLLFAVLYLISGPSSAEDVLVNTYTTSTQNAASVAANGFGNFVVVWTSYGSVDDDSWYSSIQGQRYASDGTPAGDQFQVNTWTEDSQDDPSLVIGPDGGFIVVWSSEDQNAGIRGQRFAADGSFIDDEFQVNSYPSTRYLTPSIAMGSGGNVVVAWRQLGSPGTDLSSFSIQARRFDSQGSPLEAQFQVNTYTTESQLEPSVALDSTGDFVVVWQSFESFDPLRSRVRGQRYASDGSPAGDEFQVGSSQDDTVQQYRPEVTVDAKGHFVVVWETRASGLREVWAQRYNSDGIPVESELRVATGGAFELEPDVASSANGDFVVVWNLNVDQAVVQGQRFASDGSQLDRSFQVNTNPMGSHFTPSVSATGAGEFLVAWSAYQAGGDDPGRSVWRSDFSVLNNLVFADSFESGDTSAWSLSTP